MNNLVTTHTVAIHLSRIVQEAVAENNIKLIDNALKHGYKAITQDKKEQKIFDAIYAEYMFSEQVQSFMEYIVFNYNIKKENSIQKYIDKKDSNSSSYFFKIESMFIMRELQKELSENLINSNKSEPRVKI